MMMQITMMLSVHFDDQSKTPNFWQTNLLRWHEWFQICASTLSEHISTYFLAAYAGTNVLISCFNSLSLIDRLVLVQKRWDNRGPTGPTFRLTYSVYSMQRIAHLASFDKSDVYKLYECNPRIAVMWLAARQNDDVSRATAALWPLARPVMTKTWVNLFWQLVQP